MCERVSVFGVLWVRGTRVVDDDYCSFEFDQVMCDNRSGSSNADLSGYALIISRLAA